jgi:heme/copper-type cytochrome/quinol oxidase subunit 4
VRIAHRRHPIDLRLSCLENTMKYIVGWLLGIPLGVIVLWFVVNQVAC